MTLRVMPDARKKKTALATHVAKAVSRFEFALIRLSCL
jgi:hypothetical protein